MAKPTAETDATDGVTDAATGRQGEHGATLIDSARRQGLRGPAPVHLWNPDYCGEMDLEIRKDGSWWHEGSPIGRPEMVRMFANILKFEDGRHYLVTPVEKLGIRVEDSPFIVVDLEFSEAGITAITNLGDRAEIGPDHQLIIEGTPDAPRPYVDIRGGLRGRVDRKSFYRLAEHAAEGPGGALGVRSAGAFFPLEPA